MADYKDCGGYEDCPYRNDVGSCPMVCLQYRHKDDLRVVRCRDCKHYKKISCASHTRMCFSDRGLCSASEDDYCSRGERRTND